jgi:dihydrofolate reductase
MSRVRFDISMSLDGYVTASGVRPEEPMGDGGQQLHQWAFGADEVGRDLLADSQRRVGATIAGRRTYDLSLPWWGADGPGGPARTPTFIVSHSTPERVPEAGVYTFVNSPTEALERASAVAGGRDIDVFSADIGGQLLRAGLIDELHVHLVPVLFGAGTRLFEHPGDAHIQLETTQGLVGPKATHLRYRVLKGTGPGRS